MSLKTISFPGEKTQYITPTWDEMDELAFKIARQMLAAGKKFDRIVTLAKGGWPLTRSMVDFLQVKQVASIGVKFYCGIKERLKNPHIYQDLPEKIRDEKILLFDDCADSGGSLEFVKKHLLVTGVKTITTAVLLYKPWSTFKPDYYGLQTSAWIIFPYEVVETMTFLANKWTKQGLTPAAIKTRFLQFGFSEKLIEFYGRQTI